MLLWVGALAAAPAFAQDTDTALRQKLIETAAQIHARERTLARAELDIKRFYAARAFLSLEIDRNRVAAAGALAALARLARVPRARGFASAGVARARSGLALESATTTLVRAVAAQRRRITRLAALKERIAGHRRLLRETHTELLREHEKVTGLLSARPRAAASRPDIPPDAATPGGLARGLAAQEATQSAPLLFLLKPVQGAVMAPVAPNRSQTPEAEGVRFRTRAGAQVIAPGSGRVVFAGLFRSYADVLIIDTAGGYHIVLAGLARLGVRVGDRVIAGEPVARVGTEPLYMELRHKKAVLDPVPFFQQAP